MVGVGETTDEPAPSLVTTALRENEISTPDHAASKIPLAKDCSGVRGGVILIGIPDE